MAADGENQPKVIMSIDQKRAEEGMKLFKGEAELEFDSAAATKYKDDVDAKAAKLDVEISLLTGKDNKKARSEKEKEKKALKDAKEYIDACKVVKGLKPPNGNFIKQGSGPTKEEIEAEEARKKAAQEEERRKAEEADAKGKEEKAAKEKAKKPQESAGISKAERDELEKLKNDIISRKKTLKEQGMSGGQMNKDAEIVAWVARMNELKEKENPGATAKPDKKAGKKALSSDQAAAKEQIEREIEEYRNKLKAEFGYSAKDIKNDPDMLEMQKKLAEIK